MDKIAVTVQQLRAAIDAFKSGMERQGKTWIRDRALMGTTGKLVRPKTRIRMSDVTRSYMPAAGVRTLTAAQKATMEALAPRLVARRVSNLKNTIITGGARSPEALADYLSTANKMRPPQDVLREMAKSFTGGNMPVPDLPYKIPTKGMRSLKGPAREAFNRSVILHEVAEIGKHPGKNGRAGFMGHLSAKPPLQDLNIAATLSGPGAEAASAIRALRRGEIKTLESLGFKDLNLGKERVSRHAVKRIQQALDRRQQV